MSHQIQLQGGFFPRWHVVCAGLILLASVSSSAADAKGQSAKRPNVVLLMADDLGWGDVGFHGNSKVLTPVLDKMAKGGLRLSRFYAGGPVCTPTRGSCLTGRNPNRYRTNWAGRYPLPKQELTVAGLLKAAGYRTGFFGKWHLGKLTPEGDELHADQLPDPKSYSAPWHHGFETCFAVESSVPTYNPEVWDFEWRSIPEAPGKKYIMDRPIAYGEGTLTGEPMHRWPYRFWHGERKAATGPIAGDTSKLFVDQAEEFIKRSVAEKNPFLAVVWFATPHSPIAAGNEGRERYSHLAMREQHWFGAISAMDDQIGRLFDILSRLGVRDDTMVWFCSDNGPSWVHELNSAGPFRGEKGDLYEGGIRVPALVSWPARITGGRTVDVPTSTDDFPPTILAAADVSFARLLPLDGENVLPILEGKANRRHSPLYFDYPMRSSPESFMPGDLRQMAMIEGPWKLISRDAGKSYQLFNLTADIAETTDRSAEFPERVADFQKRLNGWIQACAVSLKGGDYQ